jgi:photosystem II stability/assembly factor-like uncharacterized protein
MENLMRRSRLLTLTLLLAFLLAGCNLPSRVLTTGQPPTPMQEPVLAVTPSVTETSVFDPLLTPTVTPSLAPIKTEEVPPTATPGVLPGVQFSLLAVGRPVQVTSFDMLDLQVGWGSVDSTQNDTSGHLLRTTDGGLTWQEVTSPSGYPWGSRFVALDGLHAWAAPAATGSEQAAGFVWRTEDGGATWLASAPIPLQLQETELVEYYLPQALFFLDDQHGWLVVSMGHYMNQDVLAIFSTSNGGLSWQKLADKFSMGQGEGQDGGASMPCRVSGIAFLDTQVGFLSGDCLAVGVDDGFGLLMTRDGGKTWSAEKIPDPFNLPQAVQSAESGTGRFCAPTAMEKTPAGIMIQHTCQVLEGSGLLKNYFFVSILAHGEAGWQGWAGETAAFSSALDGYLLGQMGQDGRRQISQTRDAGKTWQAVDTVTWQMARLDFPTLEQGFALAWTWNEMTAAYDYALVSSENGAQVWALVAGVMK